MQEKPLISVIIPVYNVEKYLRECIDSVLAQTYTNYEIILVDDGSTDSSGVICDEYADKYDFVRAVHKKNSGPSETRNTGISQAIGKYIYFLDSDDYLLPEAFELLTEKAETNNADIVFFDAFSFSDPEDDFRVSQGYVRKKEYKADAGFEILKQLCQNNEYRCAIYLMFLRRQLLAENKISFLNDAYCSEDMLFTFQVFCQAQKVVQCHKQLYFRRYRKSSIVTSKKTKRHYSSCCLVYQAVRDYSVRINKLNEPIVSNYIVRCAYNALENYSKLSKQDRNECKNNFSVLKKDIISNNAYGNKALKMRCYGKLFWVAYKIYEKTVGKLLRG